MDICTHNVDATTLAYSIYQCTTCEFKALKRLKKNHFSIFTKVILTGRNRLHTY
jgi:hypothetical protein